MRVISLKAVINKMIEKKIILLTFVIIFAVLGALFGYKQTKSAAVSAQANADEFEQDIAEFDASIETLETNLETVKAQYQKQKDYCENSIYMKLDSNAYYAGQVQYTVPSSENNTLRDTIQTYLSSNEFRNLVVGQIGDINTGYFREVYYVSSAGNVITIDVYHYDEKEAQRYLDAARKCVNEAGYETTELNSSVTLRADIGVLNNQNNQNNNLKTFTSNVSDTQNLLSNKKQEKDNYTKENAAYPMDKKAQIKGILKFTLVGAIFGFVAMFAMIVLKILYGSKIESEEYLLENNITIIGNSNDKDFDAKRVALDIDLVLRKRNVEHACFAELISDTEEKLNIDSILSPIGEKGLKAIVDSTGLKDIEMLKTFAEIQNVILVVKLNNTKYEQVEKYIMLCERYEINIVGAIVV